MSTDKKINLLMGLHCHQPVDNFKDIFEMAYNKSYEPFLSVLERHPNIKLSLHYSGSLLGWILDKRPAFIDKIKKLIDRNQIELLSGGYFEPILPMIPTRDAKGQVEMLTKLIEKHFNYTPCGIWLTERVWDPELSALFKDLNIRYTILDDFHLKKAGLKKDDIFGHYAVKGFNDFYVFLSIKRLRYTMPFREIDVTVGFLKTLLEKQNVESVTFGDDCEKFGLWPYTYDWVYKKGWLERFFTTLEESNWIRTMTFSEALKESKPLGEIEIPHSSYSEMVEWCGGNFNNFFKKYPESNLMKNRMLYVSKKIEEAQKEENYTNAEKIEEAKNELYKSQSNCVYWHGIFGGVYINYMRKGMYSHIINAENVLKENENDVEIKTINLGEDKRNVILAQNRFLNLFIDPEYAGSLFEIDYKPLLYNLVSTMSRQREPYHEKLNRKFKIDSNALEEKVDRDEPIDLYEILGVREKDFKRYLNYDPYQKFSLLCHVMDINTTFSDFIKSRHVDLGSDSLFGPYTHKEESEEDRLIINLSRDSKLVRLKKCIILERGPEIFIRFDLKNISSMQIKCMFGIEFNWSIEDKVFVRNRRKNRIRDIVLVDRYCGLKVNHIFEKPVDMLSFPIYTLNETEKGIGKNFQEVSLLFCKKLALNKEESFSLNTSVRISQ